MQAPAGKRPPGCAGCHASKLSAIWAWYCLNHRTKYRPSPVLQEVGVSFLTWIVLKIVYVPCKNVHS